MLHPGTTMRAAVPSPEGPSRRDRRPYHHLLRRRMKGFFWLNHAVFWLNHAVFGASRMDENDTSLPGCRPLGQQVWNRG